MPTNASFNIQQVDLSDWKQDMDDIRLIRKERYGHAYDPMCLLIFNRSTLTNLLENGMGIVHYAEQETPRSSRAEYRPKHYSFI